MRKKKIKELYQVILCNREFVKNFIECYHYSKNINGIHSNFCFALLYRDSIIGAMIYGRIAMKNVWKKYAKKESDIIELRRLCLIDNTRKNSESFFIGKTLKYLKKQTNIKMVISYADPFYSHSGAIYKATNFKHVGYTAKSRVIFYNNKNYHDKCIRTKYKGVLKPYAIKIKQALLTGEAVYCDRPGKHIYLYNFHKENVK